MFVQDSDSDISSNGSSTNLLTFDDAQPVQTFDGAEASQSDFVSDLDRFADSDGSKRSMKILPRPPTPPTDSITPQRDVEFFPGRTVSWERIQDAATGWNSRKKLLEMMSGKRFSKLEFKIIGLFLLFLCSQIGFCLWTLIDFLFLFFRHCVPMCAAKTPEIPQPVPVWQSNRKLPDTLMLKNFAEWYKEEEKKSKDQEKKEIEIEKPVERERASTPVPPIVAEQVRSQESKTH